MKQASIDRWLLPHGAQPPWGNLSEQILSGKVLLLGTCSRIKHPVKRGTPVQLYASWQVALLDRVCRANGLRYGVLSDEYGVVMDGQSVENYTTPPEAVSPEGFVALGLRVKKALAALGVTRVCLFTANPKRTVPYCKILRLSGVSYTWTPSVQWLRELGGSTLFNEEFT